MRRDECVHRCRDRMLSRKLRALVDCLNLRPQALKEFLLRLGAVLRPLWQRIEQLLQLLIGNEVATQALRRIRLQELQVVRELHPSELLSPLPRAAPHRFAAAVLIAKILHSCTAPSEAMDGRRRGTGHRPCLSGLQAQEGSSGKARRAGTEASTLVHRRQHERVATQRAVRSNATGVCRPQQAVAGASPCIQLSRPAKSSNSTQVRVVAN